MYFVILSERHCIYITFDIRTIAIDSSLNVMNCSWLFEPEDQREDWSVGLLTVMFDGRYDAEWEEEAVTV